MSLTAKQARFVEEYLVDLNATQAAIRSGYAERTAESQASRLLRNVKVAAAVAAAQESRSIRTQVSADRVLQELARIGFSDIRDLFSWSEERAAYVPSGNLTEEQAAVVSAVKARTVRFTREDGTEEERIELELKTYDKLSALEKIGKHLGMFTDKVDLTSGGSPVRFTLAIAEKDADD